MTKPLCEPGDQSEGRFDPTFKFVKVTGINPQGFVEFEFSVGSPELCVELMLRPEAFEEFCQSQGAVRLEDSDRILRH